MRPEAEKRVIDRVMALGFPSLNEYLAARVGVSYTQLADELGDGILGMQLYMLHMQGAEDCRAFAADSLVRALRQVLTSGWDLTDSPQPNVDRSFVNITAWSYWTTILGKCSPGEDVVDQIWEHIRANAKPGWLPATVDDPLLVEAFNAAWPATT